MDFSFSMNGLVFISEEQANHLSNVEVQEGDVLLNITGDSVARVCQVPNKVLPSRVNQHVAILRPDRGQLLPEYLKYYLLDPRFKKIMLGMSSVGGTRNALTKSMIEDFEITAPDLSTQVRIATILSKLDDKIELNRKTNATLEAIAKDIFKEWFVDFRYPGATSEIQDSELGPIPKGWRVGKLGDILGFKNGKSSPERDDAYDYPVFGANGIIGCANIYNSTEKNLVIGRVGSFCGSVYLPLSKIWVTDNAIMAKPRNEKSIIFCFILLKIIQLNTYRTGSGQPLLNQNILSNIETLIPPFYLIGAYEKVTLPLFEQIVLNNQQAATLSITRDTILPKLISGDLKV